MEEASWVRARGVFFFRTTKSGSRHAATRNSRVYEGVVRPRVDAQQAPYVQAPAGGTPLAFGRPLAPCGTVLCCTLGDGIWG